MVLEVYVDGSAVGKPQERAAGYGVYFPHNSSWNISRPLEVGPFTNQRAELQAIKAALELLDLKGLPCDAEVVIYSDSTYSIKCITEWSETWRRNNWLTSGNKPVMNQDLIRPCVALYEKRRPALRLQWVKAHATNAGNIKADQLATSAAAAASEKDD